MSTATHWTQKPENREKLIAHLKRIAKKKRGKKKAGGPMAGKRHTAASRKKISAAMKAAAHARALAAVNGHAVNGTAPVLLPLTGKRLAKAAVIQLSFTGARLQLAQFEQQCEILRIYLKQAPE